MSATVQTGSPTESLSRPLESGGPPNDPSLEFQSETQRSVQAVRDGLRTPYVGLMPFQHADRVFFHGRELQVEGLLDRIARDHQHFVAIAGESGCGKSSVVRAGLLPELKSGRLGSAGQTWLDVTFTPGSAHPFKQLAQALNALAGEFPAEKLEQRLRDGEIEDVFEDVAHTLRGKQASAVQWLIVVDQFEELFDQANCKEANEFIRFLLDTAKTKQLYVAITLRAERLGDCARFDRLPKAVFGGLYLTPPLEGSEIRDAIRKPAALFGTSVDDDLLKALIDDRLRRDRDYLPLLQYSLCCIWQAAVAEQATQSSREADAGNERNCIPKRLTLTHYATACGLATGASELSIAKPLERSLNELMQQGCAPQSSDSAFPPLQRLSLCATLLRRLVITPPNEPAVSNSLKSRARLIELDNLVQTTGYPDDPRRRAVVYLLVELFRKAGFLVPTKAQLEQLTQDTEVTLCHEALIRKWQSLSDWAREEADRASEFRRLVEMQRSWRTRDGGLLSRQSLAAARSWCDAISNHPLWATRYLASLNIPEGDRDTTVSELLAYIDASEHRYKMRRRRPLYYATAAIALIAATGAVTYMRSQEQAQRQAREQAKADGNTLAYQTFDMERRGAAGTRIDLSLKALQLTDEPLTREAVRSSLWSDALNWQPMRYPSEVSAQVLIGGKVISPDGAVIHGVADGYVYLSNSRDTNLIKRKLCSAIPPNPAPQTLAAQFSIGSRYFSLTDRITPRACVYDLADPRKQAVAVMAPDKQPDKTDYRLAPDGSALMLSSGNDQVFLQPIDHDGGRITTVDVSDCRVEEGQWKLQASFPGYARSGQLNTMVVVGQTQSADRSIATRAVSCIYGDAQADAAPVKDTRSISGLRRTSPNIEPVEFDISNPSRYLLVTLDKLLVVSVDGAYERRFKLESDGQNRDTVLSAQFISPDVEGRSRLLVRTLKRWVIWTPQSNSQAPANLREYQQVPDLDPNVDQYTLSADRRYLMTVRQDRQATLWDLSTYRAVADVARLPEPFVQAAVQSDRVVGLTLRTQSGAVKAHPAFALQTSDLPWRIVRPSCAWPAGDNDSSYSVWSENRRASLRAISQQLGPPDTRALQVLSPACQIVDLSERVHSALSIDDSGKTLLAIVSAVDERTISTQNSTASRRAVAFIDHDDGSEIKRGLYELPSPPSDSINALSADSSLRAAALSSDGNSALLALQSDFDRNVQLLWLKRNAQDPARLDRVDVPAIANLERVTTVSMNSKANVAAVGTATGDAVLVSNKNEIESITIGRKINQPIKALAVSDDRSYVVIAYNTGAVAVFKRESGKYYEFLREMHRKGTVTGPPLIHIVKQPDEAQAGLTFDIPSVAQSLIGERYDEVYQGRCLTGCGSDSSGLTDAAKQRLAAWKLIAE